MTAVNLSAVSAMNWDLLPGYLIFRSIITTGRPQDTVQALVDDVILPSLTRSTVESASANGWAPFSGVGPVPAYC